MAERISQNEKLLKVSAFLLQQMMTFDRGCSKSAEVDNGIFKVKCSTTERSLSGIKDLVYNVHIRLSGTIVPHNIELTELYRLEALTTN